MNREQMNAAQEAMINWLAHPQELGRTPAKIECAKTFDLYEQRYYIFKYKKNAVGKWLLGVCGGYEDGAMEHSGHVFSEMKEYREETALEDATAIVEMIRSYWMEQAERAEKRKVNPGTFVNFVLLERARWDCSALLQDLKETWQIEDEPDESGSSDQGDTFVIRHAGAMIAVSLMPAPIPDGEAEEHAKRNYLWRGATEAVSQHQAHLMVAILGGEISAVRAGELLVKTVVSCCKQEGVLGIYANETVYQPEYYCHFSDMMNDGLFPIFNLVWFGLYNGKGGMCGYTSGMRSFGYDEMEVLDSHATAEDLIDLLSDIANYVITDEVLLQDGETIGFSEEQKLPITRSRGVAVEGDSLKIGFPG